jgi:hypothetical protein
MPNKVLFLHHGLVWDVVPVAIEAHTIVRVLGVPVAVVKLYGLSTTR